MRTFISALLLGFFLFAMPTLLPSTLSTPLSSLAAAEVVVIVNQQGPLQSITPREVSDLYLGRTRNFASGEVALVLEQPRDSAIRQAFFGAVNGMPIRQVNAYWARLQFSGEVQPPITLNNSQEVKARVSQHRNAIGYIDASLVDNSVKVVQRLNK